MYHSCWLKKSKKYQNIKMENNCNNIRCLIKIIYFHYSLDPSFKPIICPDDL